MISQTSPVPSVVLVFFVLINFSRKNKLLNSFSYQLYGTIIDIIALFLSSFYSSMFSDCHGCIEYARCHGSSRCSIEQVV